MNKETLRKLFLDKRKTLTPTELASRNEQLFENTVQFLKEKDLQHVHVFLSIKEQNEPDTFPILNWLLESTRHLAYTSKTYFKTRKLTHHPVHHMAFRESRSGIPEPIEALKIPPSLFELVFVPLISFDQSGNRIGYGAGFYDEFLTQTDPNCLKVGLAITPPLDNIYYSEPHDVKLDGVINHLGTSMFQ